ncbi:MAG: hypothetical protein IT200_14010 [Thermoleophilia bacterium]|nr:hypothetical protein [Thermoleophilia bacterium]
MRRSPALAVVVGGLALPAAGQATVIVPGTEVQAGEVAVDLDTNGRALVAYERTVAKRRGVWASTRTLARFRTRDAGVRLGSGRLELARLADGGGPDLVAWSRGGRVRVSLRRGGAYRTELLPASFPRRRVLGGGVAGRRVVLVLGDASAATVAVRSATGRWRAVSLPGPAAGRSAMRVAVSEGSGRVVAAWAQGPLGPQQAVLAAVWTPATGAWSAPRTLVPAGSFGAPVPGDVTINRRGAAVVRIGRASAYADAFLPAPEPRIHVIDARAVTWRAAPGVPPGPSGLAPDGTVLHAWTERVTEGTGRIMEAELPPGAVTWSTPVEVARITTGDIEQLSGVEAIAAAENGRVAIIAEINPGPAPDEHHAYSRLPGSAAWTRADLAASTYGDVRLIPGRQRLAATWDADSSLSALPEADLIPR